MNSGGIEIHQEHIYTSNLAASGNTICREICEYLAGDNSATFSGT